jgi:hypothetical protein
MGKGKGRRETETKSAFYGDCDIPLWDLVAGCLFLHFREEDLWEI